MRTAARGVGCRMGGVCWGWWCGRSKVGVVAMVVVRDTTPFRRRGIHLPPPARDEPLMLPTRTTTTTTSRRRMESLMTCLPGLEPTLSSELSRWGIPHERIVQGARLLSPTPRALVQSYLWVGSATNLFLQCGDSFSARGLAELRRKITTKIPWETLLGMPTQVRLKVKVTTTTKSKLIHSAAIEARVVAGIYEALGYSIPSEWDETLVYCPPSITDNDPLVCLEVHIVRDQVTIWMAASETPLHRRGYRIETSKGPLREDLAYAMLYNGGWGNSLGSADTSSRSATTHDDCWLLLDPFCGSGTIAIEGAAMVAGLPPGRLRPPPWRGTFLDNGPLHQELLLQQATTTALVRPVDETTPRVFASDRDAGAIQATRANATRAGVVDYIDLQQCALTAHSLWSSKEGTNRHHHQRSVLVVTNPPFGKRVSPSKGGGKDNVPPLLPLYQSLHHLTISRPKTSAVVLCQGMELMQRAGWNKVDKVFTSTHGGLSVTAVQSRWTGVGGGVERPTKLN